MAPTKKSVHRSRMNSWTQ